MYEADPERRYPVLYMFDGQNVFFDADATYGKSWGVADYLDYTDTPAHRGGGGVQCRPQQRAPCGVFALPLR